MAVGERPKVCLLCEEGISHEQIERGRARKPRQALLNCVLGKIVVSADRAPPSLKIVGQQAAVRFARRPLFRPS